MNYSDIKVDDPGGDIVAATVTLAAMTVLHIKRQL